jgi:hypothetical protein
MIRPSRLLMACTAFVVATGCTSNAGPVTALTALADSVLSGKQQGTCTTVASLPGPGAAPFRECRTTGADTAVLVTRDAKGVVVLVSRQWKLANSGTDPNYTALLQHLKSDFGSGDPTCQDPSLSGTMWRLPDRHLILGTLAEGAVYFAAIAGEPLCR